MIDYASRQRTPRKHIVGLTMVVALHALLFWAINSGLARKFVKVVGGPVEAVLLQETKPDIPPPPPPPPPPKNLPPPPPPPAYVPPVDIQVAAPAPVNAIAAVSNSPQPVAPPTPTPSSSPSPVLSNPPPAPVTTAAVISAAGCEKPEYPSASRRMEEEGTVQLKFLVGVDGKVIDSAVEKSSGFRRLDEAARAGLSKCQFKPSTLDGKPQQSWASMKFTWRLE